VFADGQCCVKQDDREVFRISIEDLAWAVIDTPAGHLSQRIDGGMYGGRRRHRARHTPHTVGTCHSTAIIDRA